MHDYLDGKLDLVPMIDCILLLLLFFLLTSSITTPESVLDSLLPTKGQSPSKTSTTMPNIITIVALPNHLGTGHNPADWQQRWDRLGEHGHTIGDALIRIGGNAPFQIHGDLLNQSGDMTRDHIDALHVYIHDALIEHEKNGLPRTEQCPIEIRCFSRLPWKVTMVVYDAVRAYERTQDPSLSQDFVSLDPSTTLNHARSIAFSAPPLRTHFDSSAGSELQMLALQR